MLLLIIYNSRNFMGLIAYLSCSYAIYIYNSRNFMGLIAGILTQDI